MGDRETPLPLPPSLYGRTDGRSYADVITKFSRLDGLPIFLTHGASLARFARWSSAKIIACKFHWRQYNTAWFHLSSVTKCIAKLFFRSAAAGRFKTFLHLQSRFLLCLGLQYSNIAMKSLLVNESSTNAFLEYTVLMEQSQWLRFYGTLVIFVSLGVLRLSLTLLNPLKAALNSKTVSGCLKFIHSRVSESWDKWPNKSAWTSPPS